MTAPLKNAAASLVHYVASKMSPESKAAMRECEADIWLYGVAAYTLDETGEVRRVDLTNLHLKTEGAAP